MIIRWDGEFSNFSPRRGAWEARSYALRRMFREKKRLTDYAACAG
jgi:hypothetical protein